MLTSAILHKAGGLIHLGICRLSIYFSSHFIHCFSSSSSTFSSHSTSSWHKLWRYFLPPRRNGLLQWSDQMVVDGADYGQHYLLGQFFSIHLDIERKIIFRYVPLNVQCFFSWYISKKIRKFKFSSVFSDGY